MQPGNMVRDCLKSHLGKHNCGLKDLSLNILQSAGVIEQSTRKPEIDGPPTRGADALHSYSMEELRPWRAAPCVRLEVWLGRTEGLHSAELLMHCDRSE